MNETKVSKTYRASGTELSTLYILIHLLIYLLSEYLYFNLYFTDEETVDQKASFPKVPRVWT